MANEYSKVILLCDVQSKLKASIHNFAAVESTICYLGDICRMLSLPVIATTQNSRKLGETISSVAESLPEGTPTYDKALFSMLTPEVLAQVMELKRHEIVLVGIETRICVSQTALELLEKGFRVTVLADAVSSSSAKESELGLLRLRSAGVQVMTFESWLFETIKTARHPNFREVSAVVKARRSGLTKDVKAYL